MGDTGNHRRRGIKASRSRLTRALADADIPTQAALAERIAELEQIDTAPRDMVNRAFRELPVEHRSLDRMARALGVEAFTLYKTADEPEPAADDAGTTDSGRWRLTRLTAALGAVLLALVAGLLLRPGEPFEAADRAIPPLSMGRPSVMVLDLRGDPQLALTKRLRRALADDFTVASDSASSVPSADLAALADRLRIDAILHGELTHRGRLTALSLFAVREGIRQQIWAESFPANLFPQRVDGLAMRAVDALRRQYAPVTADAPHFPLAPVQDDYLWGQFYLDEPHNELNIKRAESRFEAALRQDPNFAEAHAGLCQALMLAHWMLEEDRMLENARTACSRALLHDADSVVVQSAHAHFLLRTGRGDEALTRYETLIEDHGGYPSLYEGLAAARLARYRENGNAIDLHAAKAAARAAAELNPTLWKPLFTLATLEWYDDDVSSAIAVSEQGLARQENEYLLANLATFKVCVGDFDGALAALERAKAIAPASYVGDEFLGMIHFYRGNFARAAELRQAAIDTIGTGAPEIHEMWGQLGDAYRHDDQPDRAAQAYRRALDIVERDRLRGTVPASNDAARAYYTLWLAELRPNEATRVAAARITDAMADIGARQNEASGYRWLAQAWLMLGERDRALAALRVAAGKCWGYSQSPDLKPLADDLAAAAAPKQS